MQKLPTEKTQKAVSAFNNEMPSMTMYEGASELKEFAFSGAGQKDDFKGVNYEGGCGPWYDHHLREKRLCSKARA